MKEIKINEKELESKTNTKNITNKAKNTITNINIENNRKNIENNRKNIIKETIKIKNIKNIKTNSRFIQSHLYLLGQKLPNKRILEIL